MITMLVYNNKPFKILNGYSFKFSNNEVTFNDITIDFTGYTLADIPYKYQEIKIMKADKEENILNGELLFTGYLDDIKLSEMKLKKEDREMILTLLSPLKIATKRNISLIGTYKIKEAISRVIQPLIDDGFVLKEINIPDGQITVNYVLETIENSMNDIGFKRNIFWHINEKKEIYINSIDYLFGLPIKKVINQDIDEKGLLRLQPKISNVDYANVINFKNVRMYYKEHDYIAGNTAIMEEYPILNLPRTLKKGDIIQFNNPIILSEDVLRELDDAGYTVSYILDECLGLTIQDGQFQRNVSIGIVKDKTDERYDKYIEEGDFSYNDSEGEEKEIVLIKDNFFTNMITGFKWNGNDGAYIDNIHTITALRYTTMKFIYSAEIEKLKGIISQSGQIEKTINYNSKWTTLQQLISYARSLMTQNSNTVNQVNLEYDINPNLKVGDVVEINAPDFYIQGKFAVKEINYTYNNEIEQNWQIILKSTDLISTYIDIFRPVEKEENIEKINTVVLSEFVEEKINETHSVELENNLHTLNFNL